MTSAPAPTDSDLPQATIAAWKEIVAKYQVPSNGHATWQLLNTLVPFFGAWFLMYLSLSVSYWLTAGLAILAGLLTVRIFIIFHDCGHGSFFKSKRANDILGFITGVLTFTPYQHWRWQHSVHHATSGDLDRRGEGDIWTLTVQEYLEASRWKRFAYKLARNPFVLFVLAPLGVFFVYNRFSSKRAKGRDRRSVWWTNACLAVLVAAGCFIFGIKQYLLVQLMVTMVAGAAGIWMFYVQHQFEDAYWERREEWDYTAAALEGSSFYKLPKILQWFTGNIGFHHIHHLSSRIPNYHLEKCHRSHELFQKVKPLTLLPSLKCMTLRLWDEESRRLVGYRHARLQRRQRKAAANASGTLLQSAIK